MDRSARIFLVAAAALSCGPALAQLTLRVSVDPPGHQADRRSLGPHLSADGRCVAFRSEATNLVPGTSIPGTRAYVRDLSTGAVELISVAALLPMESWGDPCAISSDGRFVVFLSESPYLVPGDTNVGHDVFVRDRLAGTTERVSVSSAGLEASATCIPGEGAISGDGRHVVFASDAADLVPGYTNGVTDVFVRDRAAGTTERISVSSSGLEAGGESGSAGTISLSISGDGRFVSFYSAADDLVAGATTGIFLRDRAAGTTECVTVTPAGLPTQGWSWSAQLSDDGRHVVFNSFAQDLVASDASPYADTFVRDRVAGTTTIASVDSAGQPSNGWGWFARISADGRVVAFVSSAANLVPVDANGHLDDVFVRDLVAGTTELVSRSTTGVQASEVSSTAAVSGDGRLVAFDTHAPNLVPFDTNAVMDVFVRDRAPCATAGYCVGEPNSAGCAPRITAAGTPSASSGSGFSIGAEQVLAGHAGLLFYGVSGPATTILNGGYRCVLGPVRRTPVQLSGSGGTPPCAGTYAFDFNAHVAGGGDPALVAGRQVWAQYWWRDPGLAAGAGLTGALTFVLCD
jgi:Tol biopolymer transport system component